MARGRAEEALAPLLEADESWQRRDPRSRWAGEADFWLSRCQAALGKGREARASLARARAALAGSPLPADARLLASAGR